MPCGASFGMQYGPIVLGHKNMSAKSLRTATVAIPGYMTTAYLLLRLYLPEIKVIVLPFQDIIPALQNGQVEAGLIIHEGQLSYPDSGLKKLLDLGLWWYQKTNLPLPLGGNAIKRNLGQDRIADLTRILKESVIYALNNRQAALNYALSFARGMSKELADRYVQLYVNELSVDCGTEGQEAVKILFRLADQAGLTEREFSPEFVA